VCLFHRARSPLRLRTRRGKHPTHIVHNSIGDAVEILLRRRCNHLGYRDGHCRHLTDSRPSLIDAEGPARRIGDHIPERPPSCTWGRNVCVTPAPVALNPALPLGEEAFTPLPPGGTTPSPMFWAVRCRA
jgi:hypothetical protein